MLNRKIIKKMQDWKANKDKKALCIFGARQIGKTTAIRSFGKANYKQFVEINFVSDENAKEIFSGALDANTIISNLTAFCRKSLEVGNTLIFFDEIQRCPNARTAIKFLVEDGRFDYIESGSLLGVKYNEVKSYPVGFEELCMMYPMDFEEFLWANGVQESTLELLKDCFNTETPLSESIHNTLLQIFYSYIVVGGMPEVVQKYVTTHDIVKVINLQKNILELYRLDIAQYAEGHEKLKIKDIFDNIPNQLCDKTRRFFINALNKNARLNNYEKSFKWLADAGVALPCYNLTEPKVPLKLNEKHNLFKLYQGDTGLLCAACLDNVQFPLLKGDLEINMGGILENVIAQQLKANGFSLYYYDSPRIGEIDFVIQNGSKINLIEVKSGRDYKTHQSLNKILTIKDWAIEKSYVLCKSNISVDDNITYLPWYLIYLLKPFELPLEFKYEVDLTGI